MRRSRRRTPRRQHLVRGNRRDHRSRSGTQKPAPEGKLTESPRTFLPAEERLSAGRGFDVEHLRPEWWLQTDRRLLIAFSVACARHEAASRALDACRRDPLFTDPSSEVSQAGAAYLKLVMQLADEVVRIGEKIGFRTISRPKPATNGQAEA